MTTNDRVESLCSAALRHVRDARSLLMEPGASPDQAWHLAGFGPECARKACVEDSAVHKIIGHDVHDTELISWAMDLDPRLPRPAPAPAPTGAWRPEHRYECTGTRKLAAVSTLVDLCEADTVFLVSQLWCTGGYSGRSEAE